MLKVRNILILITMLGGSQGVSALAFKDLALFSQPQKVSHRDFVILRNGQFRDMRFSYGRPSGEKSEFLEDSDDFRLLAKAYHEIEGEELVDNIFTFEELGLFEAKADNEFWAYVNSPTYKGGLALRPLPPNTPISKEWPDFKRLFDENPPYKLYSEERTNELSAASKYDFLLGEANSIYLREVGFADDVYSRIGKVPTWFGICHGTAPASFSYPEPKRAVTVSGYDGRSITFSPSDIKRLAAYAWGENGVSSAQIGQRCYSDELGSREEACLDTNPASFHLALLNYMGLHNKTFIVDNAYDSMVWNRPVVSFSFNFVHPVTKLPSRELKYSLVEINDIEDEALLLNRSVDTHYLVGIRMVVELLYGDEVEATDVKKKAYKIVYRYDLEVDRNGKILGGEWETLYHPDFIWMVKEGGTPKSSEDFLIKDKHWDGESPLPEKIRALGEKASLRGNLLEYVVGSLIELSRETRSEQ